MANPIRGEVAFGSAKIRFTINTIVEFEAASGKTFGEVAEDLSKAPAITAIRDFIWYGVKTSNPAVTLEEVGDLMDQVGFEASIKALEQAIKLTFPSPAKATDQKN